MKEAAAAAAAAEAADIEKKRVDEAGWSSVGVWEFFFETNFQCNSQCTLFGRLLAILCCFKHVSHDLYCVVPGVQASATVGMLWLFLNLAP